MYLFVTIVLFLGFIFLNNTLTNCLSCQSFSPVVCDRLPRVSNKKGYGCGMVQILHRKYATLWIAILQNFVSIEVLVTIVFIA